VIPFVLKLLNHAYGIGTGKPGALQAPQASLFASLTKGIFSKGMGLEWDMITAGIILGIFIILIELLLKKKNSGFRLHLMPVAVGIYLPFSLSIPILLGGIISRFARNKENGTLISSGFIAGESIAGVVVAGMIYGGFKTGILPSSTIMSLILFAIPVIFLLIAKGKNP
ncbi:MAG TPA: oligopeptide transporter, OPT family, partial [candidate division WOR-3 bacterium]|nr:oligopeptide transporter, OPT family [candidate division WOR-3 bacterium]